MALYTFFVEKNGSTIIEQFPGADIHEAVETWHRHSEILPGLFNPEGSGINPIEDVKNVWCISGLDPKGDFYLVHVTGPLKESTAQRRVTRSRRISE
jgi:hypothetical protein